MSKRQLENDFKVKPEQLEAAITLKDKADNFQFPFKSDRDGVSRKEMEGIARSLRVMKEYLLYRMKFMSILSLKVNM